MPLSCSHFQLEKNAMRAMLQEMHPIRDEKNISPPESGYTYSSKKSQDVSELFSQIEDFLQPDDLTRERRTGYNPGHIRTLLGYDTFGPLHSEALNKDRDEGRRPIYSPNPDRNSSRHNSPLGGRSIGTPSLSLGTTSRSPYKTRGMNNNSTGLMSGTRSFACSASLRSTLVDPEDKLLADPRGRGLLWHETYRQHMQVRTIRHCLQ